MSISVEQWVIYGAIALMSGVLGQVLVGRSLRGFVVASAIGLGGAFLGAFIATSLGAQEPLAVTLRGRTVPVLWAIVGAVGSALAVTLFQRRPSPARAR